MKKLKLGFLLAIMAVVFSIIKIMGANAQISESDDYSSLGIKITTNLLNAMKNKNYEAAWLFLTQLTKNEFGSIKSFEEWCGKIEILEDVEADEVVFLSKQRLLVTFYSFGKSQAVLLINQGQDWKVAIINLYIKKMEKDFQLLADVLNNYYKEKGQFPDELAQLVSPIPYIQAIPFDPFSYGNEPYHYAADMGGWKIYSVGPDGDDDAGIKKYDSSEDGYDGDIVKEGSPNS